MLRNEKPKNPLLAMLYEVMDNILSLFQSDRALFRNIRKGKFAYKPVNSSTKETFYSKIEMPGYANQLPYMP